MPQLQALLWDVDGVLAETERDGHRLAFNRAFAAAGLPWRWEERHYGTLLAITGGRERLLHDMRQREEAPIQSARRDALARRLHALKNDRYAELIRSGSIALRGGVAALIRECGERRVRMGIVTTTSRANVEALLSAQLGEHWSRRFAVVVCGEDVQRKKPDPEAYLKALCALGVRPTETVAIEDSPAGAAAARAADVPVIVTRSAYFADAKIDDAIAIGPGLDARSGWCPSLRSGDATTVRLADIEGWLAQTQSTRQ